MLQLGGPAGMFGAERWILALSNSLPREEVTTIVGVINDERSKAPPLLDHAKRLGLDVISFDAPGRISLPAVSRIRSFLRKQGIDVLHTHGYKGDVVGWLATRKTRCIQVSTPHGWSANAGWKLAAYEFLDRMVLAGCSAVVPLSEDLHRGLKKLPWLRGKLHLIPNGVDLSEVEGATTVAPEIAARVASGARIIGYIGQLIPRKRIDVLIRAFAYLDWPDKHLYVVGDGPSRGELVALAHELGQSARVSFLGFREDRLSLLRGFAIFVLPSSLEGIPRCLMEAMAAGVPVVASDIEGCRELVEHGKSGLLFRPGDPRALALQLVRLQDEVGLRDKLIISGRRTIDLQFSATRMACEYLSLYRHLLGLSEQKVIQAEVQEFPN